MIDGLYEYADSDIEKRSIKKLNFYYLRDVISYIVPDGAKEICNEAFMHCNATAFLLPEGLERIGCMAFYNCENLQMVFIPKSVKIIENDAFEHCENLEIYCEGEPGKGWIEEPPEYRTEYVTTDADYAYDFHRGGVSTTRVQVRTSKHWNPKMRPVYKNYSREEFIKKFNALNTRT